MATSTPAVAFVGTASTEVLRLLVAAIAILPVASATAQENRYSITAMEKAACTADAMRLCSHTYPDEDQLLGCMRGHVSDLSLVCSVTFKAGMKRRGMTL